MTIPPDELAHAQRLMNLVTPVTVGADNGHTNVFIVTRDNGKVMLGEIGREAISFACNNFARYIAAVRELQKENERLKQTITRQAPKE